MKNNTLNETTYIQLLEAAVSQNEKASVILYDIQTLIRLRKQAKQMIAAGQMKVSKPKGNQTKVDLMSAIELLDATNKMIECSLSAMKETK